MKKLLRIEILSFAKHSAIVNGLLGLVSGLIQLGVAGVEAVSGDLGAASESAVAAAYTPLLWAIAGYLVGALSAWFYNFAAARFGGIQVRLE